MKVYQKFLPLMKLIQNSPLELDEIVFGITESKLTNLQRIRNYVTFAIKHILFRSRNTDFGGMHQAVLAICKKIQRYVVEDLSIKYHIFKYKNRVHIFVNTFCINSVLAEIQDNTLSVNIWLVLLYLCILYFLDMAFIYCYFLNSILTPAVKLKLDCLRVVKIIW